MFKNEILIGILFKKMGLYKIMISGASKTVFPTNLIEKLYGNVNLKMPKIIDNTRIPIKKVHHNLNFLK